MTWDSITIPDETPVLSLFFMDTLIGFIGGENAIFYTYDGGDTWDTATTPDNISFSVDDFDFINDSLGWAVGLRNDITETGIIFHTIDGGQTWRAQLPETLILEAVDFVTPQFGVAVGSNVGWQSVVLVTWDGGQHWEDQYYTDGSFLWDVALTSESSGWAVGWTGTILHTTDGGHNWTRVPAPTTEDLNKIMFVNVDSIRVGYIFGDNGTLLHYNAPITSFQSSPMALPTGIVLQQPYPNPFNDRTVIKYTLPDTRHVTLAIYNLEGRWIRTILAKTLSAGVHQVIWDGCNHFGSQVSSGIYFVQFKVNGITYGRKKIILIR
jgi:hypothetical protein